MTMASLLGGFRGLFGGKGSIGPGRPEPQTFTEQLARELCGFCTNGFVSGPAGSGKSHALEPMARAILQRSGHAALLVTVRDAPMTGFEDYPWFVSLADGSGTDLVDYLRERPAQLARLELPGEQLSSAASCERLRQGLASVFREALGRRAPDPMRKLLSVLVDDAERVFSRSDIDALTGQSLSAASRFIWAVDAPWEALYANCTHRMFLQPTAGLLTDLPPDVSRELLALGLRPLELVHLSRQVRTGPALRGRLEMPER